MAADKEHDALDWERNVIANAKNDISNFEPIYEKFYDRLLKYVFRRVNSVDTAADLVAQTFLKAMSGLSSYEVRGISILNWLYKIASNELKQYYRKNRQQELIYLEEDVIHNIQQEDMEGVVIEFEKEKLVKALNSISLSDLEMIELRFFEGLTFEEISFVKQMKLSTVKMKLYRSLDRLRKLLE